MIDTVHKLDIVKGELKIRKCVDDSGDYSRKTYDILNVFPWGSNLIACDIDNPMHARLFALSPKMLNALIWFLYPDHAIGSDAELIKKFTDIVKPIIEEAVETECHNIEIIKFSE